jgi:hydroxylaminobenzene mutase
MTASSALERQGQRLLQIGMCLILYASLEGFVIPALGSERIGLSVHTLSVIEGIFLLTLGLLWSRLSLGLTTSGIAFWLLVFSAFAILAAYTTAATWGVGNDTIKLMGELPHGLTHGSAVQETLIKVLAYSSAPTGLVAFALILWGLRNVPGRSGVVSH